MTISDFRAQLLLKELEILNQKINHFDNLRQHNRQIAIVVWGAVASFGLKEGIDVLLYLAAILPLPFWFIESVYHFYYRGYDTRFKALVSFLSSGQYKSKDGNEATLIQYLSEDDQSKFPAYDIWGTATVTSKFHKARVNLLKSFWHRNNLLIYLPLTILAMLGGFLMTLGVL